VRWLIRINLVYVEQQDHIIMPYRCGPEDQKKRITIDAKPVVGFVRARKDGPPVVVIRILVEILVKSFLTMEMKRLVLYGEKSGDGEGMRCLKYILVSAITVLG